MPTPEAAQEGVVWLPLRPRPVDCPRRRRGLVVQTFKVGGSHSPKGEEDLALLAEASGRDAVDLSGPALRPRQLVALVRQACAADVAFDRPAAHFAIVEARADLLDEPPGRDPGLSSAAVADALGCPCVAVVRGATRASAAGLRGLLADADGLRLVGLVLGGVDDDDGDGDDGPAASPARLAAALGAGAPVVLGAVAPDATARWPSGGAAAAVERVWGAGRASSSSSSYSFSSPLDPGRTFDRGDNTRGPFPSLPPHVAALGRLVRAGVDVDAILAAARDLTELPPWTTPLTPLPTPLMSTGGSAVVLAPPVVAVALDAQHWRFPAGALASLAAAGLRLVPFSPSVTREGEDSVLPPSSSGLVVGGPGRVSLAPLTDGRGGLTRASWEPGGPLAAAVAAARRRGAPVLLPTDASGGERLLTEGEWSGDWTMQAAEFAAQARQAGPEPKPTPKPTPKPPRPELKALPPSPPPSSLIRPAPRAVSLSIDARGGPAGGDGASSRASSGHAGPGGAAATAGLPGRDRPSRPSHLAPVAVAPSQSSLSLAGGGGGGSERIGAHNGHPTGASKRPHPVRSSLSALPRPVDAGLGGSLSPASLFRASAQQQYFQRSRGSLQALDELPASLAAVDAADGEGDGDPPAAAAAVPTRVDGAADASPAADESPEGTEPLWGGGRLEAPPPPPSQQDDATAAAARGGPRGHRRLSSRDAVALEVSSIWTDSQAGHARRSPVYGDGHGVPGGLPPRASSRHSRGGDGGWGMSGHSDQPGGGTGGGGASSGMPVRRGSSLAFNAAGGGMGGYGARSRTPPLPAFGSRSHSDLDAVARMAATADHQARVPLSSPPPPLTVVSLCPAGTDALLALGLGERVMGATDECLSSAGRAAAGAAEAAGVFASRPALEGFGRGNGDGSGSGTDDGGRLSRGCVVVARHRGWGDEETPPPAPCGEGGTLEPDEAPSSLTEPSRRRARSRGRPRGEGRSRARSRGGGAPRDPADDADASGALVGDDTSGGGGGAGGDAPAREGPEALGLACLASASASARGHPPLRRVDVQALSRLRPPPAVVLVAPLRSCSATRAGLAALGMLPGEDDAPNGPWRARWPGGSPGGGNGGGNRGAGDSAAPSVVLIEVAPGPTLHDAVCCIGRAGWALALAGADAAVLRGGPEAPNVSTAVRAERLERAWEVSLAAEARLRARLASMARLRAPVLSVDRGLGPFSPRPLRVLLLRGAHQTAGVRSGSSRPQSGGRSGDGSTAIDDGGRSPGGRSPFGAAAAPARSRAPDGPVAGGEWRAEVVRLAGGDAFPGTDPDRWLRADAATDAPLSSSAKAPPTRRSRPTRTGPGWAGPGAAHREGLAAPSCPAAWEDVLDFEPEVIVILARRPAPTELRGDGGGGGDAGAAGDDDADALGGDASAFPPGDRRSLPDLDGTGSDGSSRTPRPPPSALDGLESLASRRGFWRLPAVHASCVFALDGAAAALFDRPGPGLVVAVELLALILRDSRGSASMSRSGKVGERGADGLDGSQGAVAALLRGDLLRMDAAPGQRCRPSRLRGWFQRWRPSR